MNTEPRDEGDEELWDAAVLQQLSDAHTRASVVVSVGDLATIQALYSLGMSEAGPNLLALMEENGWSNEEMVLGRCLTLVARLIRLDLFEQLLTLTTDNG